MDLKDSVPAVSQPRGGGQRPAAFYMVCGVRGGCTRAGCGSGHVHWSFTILFSSGMVMSFDPNSTPNWHLKQVGMANAAGKGVVSARVRRNNSKEHLLLDPDSRGIVGP